MKMKRFQVVIVGAGISGLAAFRWLLRNKVDAIVLEMNRESGGRMTTITGSENEHCFVADIGAQFTAAGTSEDWMEMIQKQQADGLVSEVYNEAAFGKYPRYVHRNGMNSFAKMVVPESNKARIFYSSKVTRFKSCDNNNAWEIVLENGEIITSDALLITAPLPQALDLIIQQSNLTLKNGDSLMQVSYAPCFALIIHLASEEEETVMNMNRPIWKKPSEAIEGIYHQNGKGLLSPTKKNTWVIHASAVWTEKYWDKDEETVKKDLMSEVKKHFPPHFAFDVGGLHRWKYCEPRKLIGKPYWQAEWSEGEEIFQGAPYLLLCGDSFGRASVEGAFISGTCAAKRLAELVFR